MIRRVIVPVVATCGALAVGIALGAGPLNDAGHADDSHPAATTTAADTAAAKAAAFGQQWAVQAGSALYAGKLAGKSISVVVLPGADPKVVQGLLDAVAVAQGTVGTRLDVTPTLLAPEQHVMVDSLATKFAQQSQGAIGAGLSTYARAGELVGLALNGPEATTTQVGWEKTRHGRKKVVTHPTVAASRVTAQETLAAAKLAAVSGPRKPGALVLVVLGSATDPAALGGLLDGISAKTTGVVLAGDTASAAKGGTLAAYRGAKHGPKVLTVDGDDTVYGRESAVLGLVRQITPQGGDFGASGADGLIP
jgi:hypothetical protein